MNMVQGEIKEKVQLFPKMIEDDKKGAAWMFSYSLNSARKFFFLFFNLMYSRLVISDFGPRENKVCHCFHYFPISLPWSDGTRFCDLGFLKSEF